VTRPLADRIAVVAGATRGAGRGIATMLGEAGATVYCTGRSVRGRSPSGRPETIDETAELVAENGGIGIAVQVDRSDPEQVGALASRVEAERGRVDVLVNDIWGGEPLAEWGKPFWEHSLDKGLAMLRQAIDTHIITSHFFAPMMVRRRRGLIVEITDGENLDYRGSFFYDLVKVSVIRLAYSMAQELRPHGVAAVSLTPASSGPRRCSTTSAFPRRRGARRSRKIRTSRRRRRRRTSVARSPRWQPTPGSSRRPARRCRRGGSPRRTASSTPIAHVRTGAATLRST